MCHIVSLSTLYYKRAVRKLSIFDTSQNNSSAPTDSIACPWASAWAEGKELVELCWVMTAPKEPDNFSFFFFPFRIVILLPLPQVSPIPLPCHDHPCSHSQSPLSSPCQLVNYTCSLSRPYPSILPLFPSPLHSGCCQSVPGFHVSGSILLTYLFCWLGSS